MLSIGIAVVYNMGSNIIFGEISYITKALSAVLQLGVTMDYSIFLLHRYDEECKSQPDKTECYGGSYRKNYSSLLQVVHLTTIAGFLAVMHYGISFWKRYRICNG